MAGFSTPSTPNLSDFLLFLSTSVQIPVAALPLDSPYPGYALDQAIGLVLNPPGGIAPPVLYSLATYNCATHLLFLIAPDQVGQTYFQTVRGNGAGGFSFNMPSAGLVVSSSDEGTSASLTAPKWAAGLTVGQLGMMKTPWGRAYLTFIQSYGPNITGLT